VRIPNLLGSTLKSSVVTRTYPLAEIQMGQFMTCRDSRERLSSKSNRRRSRVDW
jgi:hypothetical protein